MMRNALRIAGIGLAALVAIHVAATIWPSAQRAVTIAVVVIGTILIFLMRLGFWPAARSTPRKPLGQEESRRHKQTGQELTQEQSVVNRQRWAAAIAVLLLCATWGLALLAGERFEDPASRLLLLSAINRATAILVSVAVIVMPAAHLHLRDKEDRLNIAVAAIVGCIFFAGTAALPALAEMIWDSSYGIEQTAGAIPGWSFVPIAVMAVRVAFVRMSARKDRRPQSDTTER